MEWAPPLQTGHANAMRMLLHLAALRVFQLCKARHTQVMLPPGSKAGAKLTRVLTKVLCDHPGRGRACVGASSEGWGLECIATKATALHNIASVVRPAADRPANALLDDWMAMRTGESFDA